MYKLPNMRRSLRQSLASSCLDAAPTRSPASWMTILGQYRRTWKTLAGSTSRFFVVLNSHSVASERVVPHSADDNVGV